MVASSWIRGLSVATVLDYMTLFLLTVVLAWPALAFGGVEASGQFVVAIVAVLLVCAIILRPFFDRSYSFSLTCYWFPSLLLILLTAFQLLPLPVTFVRQISPKVVETHEPILDGESMPASLPLTVSTFKTKHSLRLILVAFCVLLSVHSFVRERRHVEQVLVVVLLIACFEAILCLAQVFSGASGLYWVIDADRGGVRTGGSFVNRSHLAQFVNLGIGAGLALLAIRSDRSQRTQDLENDWQPWHEKLMRDQGKLLLAITVCVIAVCLSMSRNGFLSMVFGITIAGILFAQKKRLQSSRWMLLAIPSLAFVALMFFGFDIFYARMSTLGTEPGNFEDRWNMARASIDVGNDYPVFGSGIGAFSTVFPAYDDTLGTSVASHADNEYAQLFVEAGWMGFGILTVFLLLLISTVRKLTRQKSSTSMAIYGLIAGFAAVALHSLTDFGQRIPAVTLVSMTLLGVLGALPRVTKKRLEDKAPVSTIQAKVIPVLALCCVVFPLFTWLLNASYAHFQAESWWANAESQEDRLQQIEWAGSEDDFQQLLNWAENSVAWAPDDLERQYWLNLYRWQSVVNLSDLKFLEIGEEGLKNPDARQIAQQLSDSLAKIRRACPTFHLSYRLEGQIRGVGLGQRDAGDKLMARAATLSLGDSQTQFAYGDWFARQGQTDSAAEQLRRAVEIDGRLFKDACGVLLELNDIKTPTSMASGDVQRLRTLLSLLRKDEGQFSNEAQRVDDEINKLLLARAAAGELTSQEAAALAKKQAAEGRHEEAIALYRKALASDYNRFGWRLELAFSLQATRDYTAAMRELKICLRLRRNHSQARKLMDELSIQLASSPDATIQPPLQKPTDIQ